MLNDIKVKEPHLPTNLDKIRAFELEFDIKLPDDYIEWLLRYNGGHPLYNGSNLIEPMNEKNTSFLVAWFFALYDGDVCNLRNEIISWRRKDLPRELVPVAYTLSGDSICLCVDGKLIGKLYLWSFIFDNVFLIANSFTDFINGLYKYELDHDRNEICTYQDGRVEFIPNPDRPNAE